MVLRVALFFLLYCSAGLSLPAELLSEESSGSDSGCGCSGSGLKRDTALGDKPSDAQSKRVLLASKLRDINSKMTLIDGGKSFIGTNKPQMKDGESPLRPVVVSSFYMDTYEVSNEGTERFLVFSCHLIFRQTMLHLWRILTSRQRVNCLVGLSCSNMPFLSTSSTISLNPF